MSGEAKAKAGSNNADHEKLAGALGTIIEVLVGRELASMRASLGDLDSTLSERIKGLKTDTSKVIDDLMNDLGTRIDDLLRKLSEAEDRQKSAMADLEERNRKANEELQDRLQNAQEKTGERLKEMQDRFANDLLGQEQKLLGELGALGQTLSTVQGELHQQIEASKRTSGLLSNMANVLTGGSQQAISAQPMVPLAPAQETRVASSPDEGGGADDPQHGSGDGGDENLDNALDRVFSGGDN